MTTQNFKHVHLAIFFKDFAAWVCDASCIGLNVAGHTTAKYLWDHNIDATAYPVRDNIDLVTVIEKYNRTHPEPLTHVVIAAPWLSAFDVQNMVELYDEIQFVILSHSNVGFLQADPGGVELLRHYARLARQYPNLHVGGNSARFTEWFECVYREKCICLPNLYPAPKIRSKWWEDSPTYPVIRIGAFGAIRAEKNFMTAAAAALAIHSKMDTPVEFHMTSGGEVRQSNVLAAIREMCSGIAGFTLVAHRWETWNKFIDLVSSMDLMIQMSYSESFNMITADGISVGVPIVISPVITWAPDEWKADPDSALSVAEHGIRLLTQLQGMTGFKALDNHNRRSIKHWIKFLMT